MAAQLFYSASTGGFYRSDLHAASKLPKDVVKITAQQHADLLLATANGKVIALDAAGKPVAVNAPPLAGADAVKARIYALERTVTRRRLREAAVGVDGGWLKKVDSEIAVLRASLPKATP
jgi:hypothetical protein